MEDNTIGKLLDAEIEKTLKEVAASKTGTDEAKQLMIKLDKLHAQRIRELESQLKLRQQTDATIAKLDESKLRERELDMKIKQAAEELETKKQELLQKDDELKETKKARRVHTAVEVAGITLPLALTAWLAILGLRFEEEGKIFSSRTPQWLSGLSRLFGRKG